MIASEITEVAFLVLAVAAFLLVCVVGVLVLRRGLGRFSLSASPKDGVKVDLTGVQRVERAVRDEIATVRDELSAMRSTDDARWAEAERRWTSIEDRMDRYEAKNSREHEATAEAVAGLTGAVTGLAARMDGVEDAMTTPGGH